MFVRRLLCRLRNSRRHWIAFVDSDAEVVAQQDLHLAAEPQWGAEGVLCANGLGTAVHLFRFDAPSCQLQPWATYALPEGRTLGSFAFRPDGVGFVFVLRAELEARRGSVRSRTLLGFCRVMKQPEGRAGLKSSSERLLAGQLSARFASNVELALDASVAWLSDSESNKTGVCVHSGAAHVRLMFMTSY